MSGTPGTPLLSVVIPCYNEEAVLPALRQRLVTALDALDVRWEVLLVDDGSRDRTHEMLVQFHHEDPRFVFLSFSRNFGHQPAVMAGISYARGDVVAVMDADLQDPPEVLAQCLAKWREGFDVIYAVRQKRKENVLKRAAYASFYRLLKAMADIDIPLDSGDFCVMDRRVADVLRQMPERNIFVRGLRAWSGFRQYGMAYERDSRAAGETKYPFRRLVRLAANGIFSFSTMPLRLTTWFGLAVLCLCAVGVAFIVAWKLFGFTFMGHTASQIPGWSGLAVALLFVSGVQMLMLGVLGEYMARIYDEVKGRPRWVVSDSLGLTGGLGAVTVPVREEEAL